jgi:hypothetical protein
LVIWTDASDLGFGYSRLDTGATGDGMWKENLMHINQKEMTAVLFGLKALCTDQQGKHVKIMCPPFKFLYPVTLHFFLEDTHHSLNTEEL